ncbi:MAG TPA: hypothetical protein VD996_02400 [Chitinophagaceae bacterium]|nr:hypothetical protein [Chitinophagaceae bacterium]
MSALTAQLSSFVNQSNALFAQAKERAQALPANTVQVWPGGATFNSIQAAINSITNASPQVQYQVAVGSGTYNENVTMKDYVYIVGAEQDLTTITAPPQNTYNGVVNSASGCGISDVTINAPGGGWGSSPCGIKICGSGNFHIKGVTINCTDSGNEGNNVRAITNNTGSYAGNVVIGQSVITVSGSSDTTASGMEFFGMGGFTVFCNILAIEATGSSTYGVTTAVNATVTLDNSKIIANIWALYNSDGTALITANQCTIQGPVSSGVVVNP